MLSPIEYQLVACIWRSFRVNAYNLRLKDEHKEETASSGRIRQVSYEREEPFIAQDVPDGWLLEQIFLIVSDYYVPNAFIQKKYQMTGKIC